MFTRTYVKGEWSTYGTLWMSMEIFAKKVMKNFNQLSHSSFILNLLTAFWVWDEPFQHFRQLELISTKVKSQTIKLKMIIWNIFLITHWIRLNLLFYLPFWCYWHYVLFFYILHLHASSREIWTIFLSWSEKQDFHHNSNNLRK